MITRTKLAASALLIAAFAASATPAIAADASSTTIGKLAGNARQAEGLQREHRGPLAALVTAGTITQAQATTVESATRTALHAARTTNFNAGLAALVSNNTITDALAEAAKATSANANGKRGHADLSTWTEAQRSALHTWLQANEPDRATIAKAAVAKLVTAGTITSAQATAINAAFASAPVMGDGGRGHHGDRAKLGAGVTPTTA